MTTVGSLTGKSILRFYLPLAVSWLFMGLEGPISVGVISKLPKPEVSTAAFLILMSLAIWIESPVIDLLSTSTTLAKDRKTFLVIRRFVLWLMLWVTAVHALVAFTPIYWTVTEQVLGVDPEVARAARPGLMIMTIWSAFIGWRRFLQGILIRNGLTRAIGVGTSIRVTVIALSAFGLAFLTQWPSIVIAASALLTSVIVEATFIHLISRKVIHRYLSQDDDQIPPLETKRLVKFHFPLTATTMVKLLTGPVIAAGLARSPDSTQALAAYQIAGTVIFLFRAFGFCLPEVVIALYRDEASKLALRNFCLGVAFSTSLAMLFMTVTGIDAIVFERVLGAKPELVAVARAVFLISALAPFLDATQSYFRGVLTAHHLTISRMVAVGVSTAMLVGAVAVGVGLRWSGPILAGVAMTVSLSAELLILVASWFLAGRRGLNRSLAAH